MSDEGSDSRPIPDPTTLTTEAVNAARQHTDREIRHLRELVDNQFALIERQRVEQKQDTKAAVDAALAAAKEAVKEQTAASQLSTNKSETSFTEQLKQQNVTFSTANAGLMREIGDVKERVGKVENLRQGGQDTGARMLSVVLAVVAVGSLVLAVLAFTSRGA
jgi:hypothetical protein